MSPSSGKPENSFTFGRGYPFAAALGRLALAMAAGVLFCWFLLFHVLFVLFLPLFFLMDWMRPHQRGNPSAFLRFLWRCRPRRT